MKTCTKCGAEKDVTCFNKRADSPDGLTYECSDCAIRRGKDYYQKHKDENSIKCKQWRQGHKDVLRKYARDHYQRTKHDYSLTYRKPEYISKMTKKYFRRLKEDVISAYGGVCVCCGENRLPFLTVEHSKHDGKEHRKRVKQKVYQDLRKRGFPKDIGVTILCWNCNMATRYGAVCPHKLAKEASDDEHTQ
jgi:hypothetical protein